MARKKKKKKKFFFYIISWNPSWILINVLGKRYLLTLLNPFVIKNDNSFECYYRTLEKRKTRVIFANEEETNRSNIPNEIFNGFLSDSLSEVITEKKIKKKKKRKQTKNKQKRQQTKKKYPCNSSFYFPSFFVSYILANVLSFTRLFYSLSK